MRARRAAFNALCMACGVFSVWMPAEAQTVYRCGVDGRSYSHRPCPDGRAVRTDDARTATQRGEAAAAVGRHAAAARELEGRRHHDEALAARTGPAGFRTGPVTSDFSSRPASAPKPSKASAKTIKKAAAKRPQPRKPPRKGAA